MIDSFSLNKKRAIVDWFILSLQLYFYNNNIVTFSSIYLTDVTSLRLKCNWLIAAIVKRNLSWPGEGESIDTFLEENYIIEISQKIIEFLWLLCVFSSSYFDSSFVNILASPLMVTYAHVFPFLISWIFSYWVLIIDGKRLEERVRTLKICFLVSRSLHFYNSKPS